MPSEAEARIAALLGERRPATAAASAAAGYSSSSESTPYVFVCCRGTAAEQPSPPAPAYGAQPRARLQFASRPATAPKTSTYKPVLGSYSYGTAKYGGRVGVSGAARGTSTFTSSLASRTVASTLASSSAASSDDLLVRLRQQRAQREAQRSRQSVAAASHGARKFTTASAYGSSAASRPALSSTTAGSKYAHKPSAHVVQLKKSTERLAASPRAHLRSELAAKPERSAMAALAARPKPRTTKYYRETDYGVGYSRGYGRTASSQLGELSPAVSSTRSARSTYCPQRIDVHGLILTRANTCIRVGGHGCKPSSSTEDQVRDGLCETRSWIRAAIWLTDAFATGRHITGINPGQSTTLADSITIERIERRPAGREILIRDGQRGVLSTDEL